MHTSANKVGDVAVALGERVAKQIASDFAVDGAPTTSSTMNNVAVIASGGLRGDVF